MARKKNLPPGFRRRSNGLLEYRFSHGGAQRSVYGKNESECYKKSEEMIKRLDNPELEPDPVQETESDPESIIEIDGVSVNIDQMTVDEYFEFYMRDKVDVSESTLINTRMTYRRISNYFGDAKIKDVRKAHIKEFVRTLRDEVESKKEVKGSSRDVFTSAGVQRVITLLKSVFAAAEADDIIAQDPAKGLKQMERKEPEARETIHRRLDESEQGAFFKAAEGSIYYYLYEFLLRTGMRIGEALALRWQDIDYEEGVIHVNKTVTKCSQGVCVHDKTKTKHNRDIPITSPIKKTLIMQRELTFKLHGGGVEYVFPNRDGVLARPSSVATCANAIAKSAGIERFGIHALRHTFASEMIDAGLPYTRLQQILGHQTPLMTLNLYYHASTTKEDRERDKEIMERQTETRLYSVKESGAAM